MNEEYLATWKRYQAAWSDISAEERKTLLSGSVAADAVYTDPTNECHGLQELIARIEQSQQKTPGADPPRFGPKSVGTRMLLSYDQQTA